MSARCVNVTKVDSKMKHKAAATAAEEEDSKKKEGKVQDRFGVGRKSARDDGRNSSSVLTWRRKEVAELTERNVSFFLLLLKLLCSSLVRIVARRGGPGNGDIIVNVVGWQIVHARSNVNIRSAGRPFRYVSKNQCVVTAILATKTFCLEIA